MPNIVKMNAWKGVFSNADLAQVPEEYCAELENLRPVNGKLVKTFGIGSKIATALGVTANNLYTYIHDQLSGDKLYILVYVNAASDNAVTVYGWDGAAWTALGSISGISLSGGYYHNAGRNPIVYSDGILRILPGIIGESPARNEAKGLWLGYINRVFFDGLYSPTAQFYGMEAVISRPAIDVSHVLHSGDSDHVVIEGAVYQLYYKFSYLYDGVQESLLSEPKSVKYTSDDQHKFIELYFSITNANHNKRITGIKIYRSINPNGPFYHIDSIDLMRPVNTVNEDTDGAIIGDEYVYIPHLTHTVDTGYSYKLTVEGNSLCDVTPIANGSKIFHKNSGTWTAAWNGFWSLQEDTGGGYTIVDYDTSSGAYCGEDVIIVNTDLGETSCASGVLYFDDNDELQIRFIKDSYKQAVLYIGTTISIVGSYLGTYQAWKILNPSDGIYCVVNGGTYVQYHFFDTGISATENQHPLQNENRSEECIKVNGEFARIINGRLIQANVILDPGGSNEAHDDWGSYSELKQYDVTPVSNVLNFPDRKGGALTGLAEIFGNAVFLKRNTFIVVNTKSYPEDPAKWTIIESAHNIGNIAKEGYIEAAGDLYICYVDGIYRLSPNNLAATDSTPTERLRVSEPIGDTYNALSLVQKQAIKAGYDNATGEVFFVLSSEIWAFNISTEQWREISSGITPSIIAEDENGQALVFQNSDKKLYGFGTSESVAVKLVTKTLELSAETMRTIRYVAVTYKSAVALTMKVYYDDEIPSGSIAHNVTYSIREKPYINGSTFAVTYNGTAYHHGDTFTGIIGKRDYTTSGTGVVELFSTHTLPANGAHSAYRMRIGRWAQRIRIEITDTAGTTDVDIDSIEIAHD